MRKYLSSKDHHLVGSCMRGLALLEDKDSYPQIIDIFINARMPIVLIKGSVALVMMNDPKMLLVLLKKFQRIKKITNKAINNYKDSNCTEHKEYALTMHVRKNAVINELLSSMADIAKVGDCFYEFLRIYDTHHETGILNLCEKIIDNNPNSKLNSPQQTLHDYGKGKIKKSEVIEYLTNSAKSLETTNPLAAMLYTFITQATLDVFTNKLIYCIFLILFIDMKDKK